MEKINEDLLKKFMLNFFGYGNLKGDYWFVGMEEGGDTSEDRISSMMEKWKAYDEPTLLDMKNKGEWKKKYQPTWGPLIKILLNYENENAPTLREVIEFQANKLGRDDSNNCIVELFPLPSPNLKEFSYSTWTDMSCLQSRKEYKSELQEPRIKKLRKLISENKPKFVIFYGVNYLEHWCKIIGVKSENFEILIHGRIKTRFYKSNKTLYVIINHPVARGVNNNAYLKAVVKKMKEYSVDISI